MLLSKFHRKIFCKISNPQNFINIYTNSKIKINKKFKFIFFFLSNQTNLKVKDNHLILLYNNEIFFYSD